MSSRARRIDGHKQLQVIELYREQRLSTYEVARQLEISDWSVRNILIRNSVPRRSISEASMRYQKTNFIGGPEEKG